MIIVADKPEMIRNGEPDSEVTCTAISWSYGRAEIKTAFQVSLKGRLGRKRGKIMQKRVQYAYTEMVNR